MTDKKEFVLRRCERIFYPQSDLARQQCPRIVPETRRATAKYCSTSCYMAVKRQTRDANRRAKANAA
jgi:hypothetical protein